MAAIQSAATTMMMILVFLLSWLSSLSNDGSFRAMGGRAEKSGRRGGFSMSALFFYVFFPAGNILKGLVRKSQCPGTLPGWKRLEDGAGRNRPEKRGRGECGKSGKSRRKMGYGRCRVCREALPCIRLPGPWPKWPVVRVCPGMAVFSGGHRFTEYLFFAGGARFGRWPFPAVFSCPKCPGRGPGVFRRANGVMPVRHEGLREHV